MKRTSCTMMSTEKVEDKREWECDNLTLQGDQSTELSWPQRSYVCSFCKRAFNSAQALGGHMNVHRRDRARLRQLPSWVFDQCPNPSSKSNLNPTFSSSNLLASRSTKFLPCHCPDKSLLSRPLTKSFASSSYHEKRLALECSQVDISSPQKEDLTRKSISALAEIEELKKGFTKRHAFNVSKKGGVINLEMEMGCNDPKEKVLDLELRLGYMS
ncbi:hypothetical protein K2173_025707 [Erythroxylum novogranatense]|uniref:C2H2-type domain-containing protein n=1 Tax=Erythroxylum novogranatense TaxID=1862640 RepID=A0AAV8SBB8_9ROSI|nr:hypothetical protein K2173_025707 [Erythroxylum novogranatense]